MGRGAGLVTGWLIAFSTLCDPCCRAVQSKTAARSAAAAAFTAAAGQLRAAPSAAARLTADDQVDVGERLGHGAGAGHGPDGLLALHLQAGERRAERSR